MTRVEVRPRTRLGLPPSMALADGEQAWSTEADELMALRHLNTYIESIEKTGYEQLAAQDDALAAVEMEQASVEDALARIAVAKQRDARDQELVLTHFDGAVPFQNQLKPLLQPSDIANIPILRAHASERHNMRTLLSAPQWSAQDIDCLHQAIRSERTRASMLTQGALNPDDPGALDWIRIAANVPFHTPSDCRTRWNLVERPGTNFSRWKNTEKSALAEYMSRAEPNVSWEKVAHALGTHRAGFQALETYQQGVRPVIAWTNELDAELLAAVQQHGPEWPAVARQLGLLPTYASLCQQRHARLKSSTLVHGKWSTTEDAALRAAVAEYGCDWKRVEVRIPGRTGQQCRERWVGRLANIPEGETQAPRRTWTAAEDERLRSCVDTCKTWVEVAKFVGGRTDKMVRERWLLLKRRDEEKRKRKQGSDMPH